MMLAAFSIAAAGALSMLILLAPSHVRTTDALDAISFGAGLFCVSFLVLAVLIGPKSTWEKAL